MKISSCHFLLLYLKFVILNMNKAETVLDFYSRNQQWLPNGLHRDIGHFNVFRFEQFRGDHVKPYARRDYFKITLVINGSKIEYADKIIEVTRPALIFTNPFIPYRWEYTDREYHGMFCIFDQAFFHQHGNLNTYSPFQPNGNHVYELSDAQLVVMQQHFERMFDEINSDFIHKYDVLRTIVYEVVLFALKMQPATTFGNHENNASQRITTLFLELLERQFPLDEHHRTVRSRTPNDYATQLNIHANYLNRALKEITGKTTSQIIAERVLQEAKILLKQTTWGVAEIAFALGFNEPTHFNNFFKKHLNTSPTQFRKV